jgi:hypothetical protein
MKSVYNDTVRTSYYKFNCPMCPEKIDKGSEITQLREDASMTLRNPDVRYGPRWIHCSCTTGHISVFNKASSCIKECYMDTI